MFFRYLSDLSGIFEIAEPLESQRYKRQSTMIYLLSKRLKAIRSTLEIKIVESNNAYP